MKLKWFAVFGHNVVINPIIKKFDLIKSLKKDWTDALCDPIFYLSILGWIIIILVITQ